VFLLPILWNRLNSGDGEQALRDGRVFVLAIDPVWPSQKPTFRSDVSK
jgi:hypothetical protein